MAMDGFRSRINIIIDGLWYLPIIGCFVRRHFMLTGARSRITNNNIIFLRFEISWTDVCTLSKGSP